MNGEEFGEELYRENLYYEYKDELEIANKEIERLNNIINGIDEILKEHINECIAELNMIMESENFDYVNECSREFDVIRKNIEMIMEKIEELKGSDKE